MKIWKLFRIFGIDICADVSVVGLAFLVGMSFLSHYSFSSWAGYALGALVAILVMGCLLIHELSHALIAKFVYHYPVPSITFFMLGGATTIGDSKDGVTSSNMRGELVFTLAGPASSFLLGGMFYAIAASQAGVSAWGEIVATYLALVNVVLGIFNMLPIFPMDGGRVLRSIANAYTHNFFQATRFAIAIGKISIFTGMTWAFFSLPLFNFFWLGLMAFFMWNGASAEESAVERKIDEEVLRKHVGKQSARHGEPFVRTAGGEEHEIWELVPYCLNSRREESAKDLMANFPMSHEEAEAAWLFCRWHRELAVVLESIHNSAYQEELMEEISWWSENAKT